MTWSACDSRCMTGTRDPFKMFSFPVMPGRPKRSKHSATQHIATLLRAFGHHVATCCDVLQHVGCYWLKFENCQIFQATFVDVARCCRACTLVRHATRCNKVAKRVQHVEPNNVAICCVQMLRSFGRGLQILGQQCCAMLC